MNLTYGSVCSGIEAASVAWHQLGWKAAWFSEVDAFPSAVLAHHYPNVSNHGDMRWLPLAVSLEDIEAPDILVGGTPCQSFSLAGLRKGISDTRGQLTLKYVELANEIDTIRIAEGKPECIVVWENVPGVLSSRDNAFGCFLAALSGESEPLAPEGKARWSNAGVVFGPQRTVAWRTLDAQHFGLAQRRKRVFVVASARTDFHPAQVLLESYGLRGNTSPRREARKEVAGTLTARFGRNGGAANDDINGRRIVAFHHNAQAAQLPTESRDTSISDTLSCSQQAAVAFAVIKGAAIGRKPEAGPQYGEHLTDGTCYTLNCVDQHAVAYAFKPGQSEAAGGIFVTEDFAPTLQSQNNGSTATPAVAYMPARSFASDGGIDEHFAERDVCDALHTASGNGNKAPLIARGVTVHGTDPTVQKIASYDETAQCLRARTPGNIDNSSTTVVQHAMQVRRLTPRECERLQGFPDDYTLVPHRNKPAADGPRYKALGNSMAVPCMQWIGQRIERALKHSWMNPDEWL